MAVSRARVSSETGRAWRSEVSSSARVWRRSASPSGQAAGPQVGVDPLGGGDEHLVVEAGGVVTVEGEPAEHHHVRRRLVGEDDAARDRSSCTKPWARKRPSSRWTTRCSRCRCTTCPSSEPGSRKTMGRSGASRRQSPASGPDAGDAKRVEGLRPAAAGRAAVERGELHGTRAGSSRAASVSLGAREGAPWTRRGGGHGVADRAPAGWCFGLADHEGVEDAVFGALGKTK
jgi:hypothetical protein